MTGGKEVYEEGDTLNRIEYYCPECGGIIEPYCYYEISGLHCPQCHSKLGGYTGHYHVEYDEAVKVCMRPVPRVPGEW